MKYLTERRAWLLLAKEWDKATQACYGGSFQTPSGQYCLCFAVSHLYHSGPLSRTTRDDMHERLQKHRPAYSRDEVFFWPTDKTGAKKRAAFCRKMAKLCVRKKALAMR